MRWLSLVVVVAPALAAAKPIWRPPPEPSEKIAEIAAAELAADIRARNVAGITKRLATPFTAGPLWFPDAACTKRFGTGGLVGAKDAPVLARCLAKLDLQMSTRRSGLRDGAVLTAKPGFEIELAFLTSTSAQVRWLSSPAHEPGEAAQPMLTAQAFEALRTRGSTQLDAVVATELDGERGPLRAVTAWLRVCVDATGKVTKATVASSTSTKIGEVFLRAIGDWQFQPFKLRATPMPVCALSLLTYPAANAAAVEALPSNGVPPATAAANELDDFIELDVWGAPPLPPLPPQPASITARTLETLRRRGSSLVKPNGAAQREIGTRKVSASAKVCIDRTGTVSDVGLIKRSVSTAWNTQIDREARTWIFRAYTVNGIAQPACAVVTFAP